MKVEQIYTGCLAHAAYYIESNKEAAIFDPLREVQPYLDRAARDDAKIKYVFETHFHADFVSGHLDLQKKAGAKIVFGPLAKPDYDAIIAEDGQIFKVGDYQVKAIHTPGHTMESTTYLLIDENGNEHGLITGDTLFIGDVGRPDLAQHVVKDLTEKKLAGHLYDSLRKKIMPLSDDLIIYPNHGAGSACGKKMSSETTDTLGHQKKVNYALQDMTKEEFIEALLEGLTTPPGYFPQNVLLNIQGYESFDTIMDRAKKALSPVEFEDLATSSGALILDTRDAEEFAKAFIPNSINIGLKGSFAPWVGEMIPGVKQPILLVTEKGKEEEAITRLSRVGYDNVLGYLKGGFDSWLNSDFESEHIERISAREFEKMFFNESPIVIDVRKRSEYNSEHIRDAHNIPLNEINKHLEEIPDDEFFVLHCAGGYRSMIAASILKQRGWDTFVDIREGFKGVAQTKVPRSEYSLPESFL
ncbi:MAG TPA: MBL fold metallo-hydrolase [Christiangramia sp.]|nr:MBL fold metallo-hydrolase [Christiangramia sp.]